MDGSIVTYGFQCACYLIELGLIAYVALSRHRAGTVSVAAYLSCQLVAGLGRTCALQRYGVRSHQYCSVYWTTDFLLVISAFFLLSLFFRRACLRLEKMWGLVRWLLAFITLLVLGISGLSFSHNYSRLFPDFVIEFNQNLYFTCLVLITLLYLLLQQIGSTDDQLGLLVCGMGIQFAGPTATLALLHLTGNLRSAESLTSFIMRFCTLGMLLVWAYAIIHVKEKATQVTRRELPALAEVTANLNV
jgi:hypothetical protein